MKLPLLLAGPIIRRADHRRISIWVAVRQAGTVRADLFHADTGQKIGSGRTATLPLGDRLHIALVPITPEDGDTFPRDVLLTYEVLHNGKSLVRDHPDLTYDGLPLPSLFLPGDRPPLQILHGSCRKLHGEGEDCLAAADTLIARHPRDLKRRPSVLFLSGDQIYADDVAGPLMPRLTALARQLTGWHEPLPGLDTPPSFLPIYGRDAATELAGFTSSHPSNHLLTFGEYAALYMLAWNGELWPDEWPASEMVIPPLLDGGHRVALQKKYDKELAHLQRTRAVLPAIRRALANIPTYMTFDDHEITDDWNITALWHDRVSRSPLGRRVIANALAAYWAFQGYGNDPDRFQAPYADLLPTYFTAKGSADHDLQARFEQTFWSRPSFSYHAPTRPVAFVLDTRSTRRYDSPEGPSRLLADPDAHLADLAARAGYRHGDPLILISPTPICGYEPVERLQSLIAPLIGPHRLDDEAWRSNLNGYLDLLLALSRQLAPRWTAVLSGDVHYAFNLDYTFHGPDALPPLRLLQLTGGALKNTGFKPRFLAGTSTAFSLFNDGTARESIRFQTDLPAAEWSLPTRWTETKTLLPLDGPTTSPLVGDNTLGWITLEHRRLTHRLLLRTEEGDQMATARFELPK